MALREKTWTERNTGLLRTGESDMLSDEVFLFEVQ